MTEPILRVHRGAPDDEELAALVAALTVLAAGSGAGPGAVAEVPGWHSRGAALPPRPGAWRLSGLPR